MPVRVSLLQELAEVLGIPEVVKCYQRSISSELEALCILLKRHSYPCRYSDMMARFGKPMEDRINYIFD